MAHILLGSWNVRGLTDSNRKYLVRNWINSLGHPIDILALQEIKAENLQVKHGSKIYTSWLQQYYSACRSG
jgi:exonuclease III